MKKLHFSPYVIGAVIATVILEEVNSRREKKLRKENEKLLDIINAISNQILIEESK